jgi:RimJ/RimL family protein N-acetyltransferase
MVEIETDRLRLRPFADTDLDQLLALWTDPHMRRFLWDDTLVSREQTAAEIERSCASFAEHGFGYWLVFTRERTSAVGFCGLRHSGEPPEVELLYGIDSMECGLGLATEASAAVLRYAFESLELDRVFASADAPNTASFRVMDKLGMHFVRRSGEGEDALLHYALSRAAFRPTDGWYRVIETTRAGRP